MWLHGLYNAETIVDIPMPILEILVTLTVSFRCVKQDILSYLDNLSAKLKDKSRMDVIKWFSGV